MWRPFASNIVNHSFETFAKANEKTDIVFSKERKNSKEKPDLSNLFPYKHTTEELQQRMKKFSELKDKVNLQRKLIKAKDQESYKLKLSRDRRQNLMMRKSFQKKHQEMLRIRSFLSNKTKRRTKSSLDNSLLFDLTATDVPTKRPNRRRTKTPNFESRYDTFSRKL